MFTEQEYRKLMQEAREEFLQWEQDKRKTRKKDKETFKAQRLAKLHMLEMQR